MFSWIFNKFPTSLLVTPGIRLQNDSVNDQKRVATPEFALSQGATHLVVGRSILKSCLGLGNFTKTPNCFCCIFFLNNTFL